MRPWSVQTYDVDDDCKYQFTFVRDEEGYVYVRKSHVVQLWSGSVNQNNKHTNTDWSIKCSELDIEFCEEKFLIQDSLKRQRVVEFFYL